MIETDDIFLGAFALARGGLLAGVAVEAVNGRRIAVFQIDGADVAETERSYYQGPAVVDLQRLKAAVRRLKDEAFSAIRQEERRSHAVSTDQPRTDRRHQAAGAARITRR